MNIIIWPVSWSAWWAVQAAVERGGPFVLLWDSLTHTIEGAW